MDKELQTYFDMYFIIISLILKAFISMAMGV